VILDNHRKMMLLAGPIILANLSSPLLGLVDTAVIGQLGDAALLGAVAVSAMLFSFLFWGFGFLRMGTTALVAQALGRGDSDAAMHTFLQAAMLAVVIGLVLWILQTPIATLSFTLLGGSELVEEAAQRYFSIRIWGAPVNLLLLAMMGYLLGRQDSKSVLYLQLVLNLSNIILDIFLVVFLHMNVEGVALATVLAECIAVLFAITIIWPTIKSSVLVLNHRQLLATGPLKHMMQINRDIMIRTLCLIFAFAWFTDQGARFGDTILAANMILMQFVTFAAFFLDGFALAAESLVGQAVGANDRKLSKRIIRTTFELGVVTALLLSLLLAVSYNIILVLLTSNQEVINTAQAYASWIIIAPVASVAAYLLDGIFIGAALTRQMRSAMIVSLAIFLFACWGLVVPYANHGLWASLMIYYLSRAASLAFYLPKVWTGQVQS
jgi:multidrug resistance protein, MATE family